MKGRQLAIVLVLLLALGGAALFLHNRSSASWSTSATGTNDKVLDFPLNDVAQIRIKGDDGEAKLVKKDETWRVAERADYPADFQKVASLLRTLWELRATQQLEVGPSQLGRLQLEEPAGGANSSTLIELQGAGDKRLAALLLGKKQMQSPAQGLGGGGGIPVGRYVRVSDRAGRVFLVADSFEEVHGKPEFWLNRDFVRIENSKSIALAGSSPAMNWTVARENPTGQWSLSGSKPGEELDQNKINSAANYLAGLSFVDVLAPGTVPGETGLDHPSLLKVETFDGFAYELRIGKLVGENYPVLVSVKANLPNERTPAADEKPENKASLDQQFQAKHTQLEEKLAKEEKLADRPYLIAKATIEQLLKDRSALLKPPPSPTPSAAPATAKSPAAKPRPK